jgi:hypothetical protein
LGEVCRQFSNFRFEGCETVSTAAVDRFDTRGPPDRTVSQDSIIEAPARVRAARVSFEPGARTAWHIHPLGQTLRVEAIPRAVLLGPVIRQSPESRLDASPELVLRVPHWGDMSSTVLNAVCRQSGTQIKSQQLYGDHREYSELEVLTPQNSQVTLYRPPAADGNACHSFELRLESPPRMICTNDWHDRSLECSL